MIEHKYISFEAMRDVLRLFRAFGRFANSLGGRYIGNREFG